MRTLLLLTWTIALLGSPLQAAEPQVDDSALQELAAEFLAWRRIQQPVSDNVLTRLERPDGWVPEVSPAALGNYRQRYRDFLLAVERLETRGWSVAARVDARLLRAAIQRVFWELEVLESPHRDPGFYLQQTLGSLFELLLPPPPIDDARARNLLLRLEHIPATLTAARSNLDRPVRPFAEAAIAALADIEPRMSRFATALAPAFPADLRPRLSAAAAAAASALLDYRVWLEGGLNRMQTAFAIGPLGYQWFLINVALLPYSPAELLAIGSGAWERAVAWAAVQDQGNPDLPALPLYPSVQHQIDDALARQREIRDVIVARGLLTLPEGLPQYRFAPVPDVLQPLLPLGTPLDLTSETRLDQDAVRYVRAPAQDLPYFEQAAARDPRPMILHEGVPGHYLQLALSWANPDPIRRRYIDAAVNEGIAFYFEEVLLRAGLFDFRPQTQEIIRNFMRLRAAMVEVDVRLAIGDFTIGQAADYLRQQGGMDADSAMRQALRCAAAPGQAIAFEAGKTQILRFLADARLQRGDAFSLRDFHDALLRNGNVPIVLQRWEYLGLDDDLLLLDALGGKPATVPQ